MRIAAGSYNLLTIRKLFDTIDQTWIKIKNFILFYDM